MYDIILTNIHLFEVIWFPDNIIDLTFKLSLKTMSTLTNWGSQFAWTSTLSFLFLSLWWIGIFLIRILKRCFSKSWSSTIYIFIYSLKMHCCSIFSIPRSHYWWRSLIGILVEIHKSGDTLWTDLFEFTILASINPYSFADITICLLHMTKSMLNIILEGSSEISSIFIQYLSFTIYLV